ncbi:MarR family winged helix-turn-helix transcriptional regulator [Ectobacillus panaciterrae]|uniref:MarR family winged helix-turn-helix transcriptional regulator n=1 Tax=Ectobacillus panaciterrae TaxID=363872 RepID=UPI00040147AC|nr:MarR family transcriptional regulator [Ectobacillus panaciterrae]
MNSAKEDLLQELSTQMFAAFRTLRSEIAKTFDSFIPMNEFVVLRVLNRNKKEMVSRVANELHVSNSHITAVSEKLIQKGLLTRSRCESDRRVVFLEITEQGNKLVQEMEARKQEYIKEKFSFLTEDEIKLMIHVYRQLI